MCIRDRLKKETPILGELRQMITREDSDDGDGNSAEARRKRRERDRKRYVPFVVSYCNYWKVPLHKTIQRIKSIFQSLKWLRIPMAYKRFPNVTELLQADLVGKLNKQVESLDFRTLNCNCR